MHFKDAPPQDTNPGYHIKIKKPIDLTTIGARITAQEYTHCNDFLHAIQQMCSNTTLFYDQTHFLHNLAVSLLKHLFTYLDTICDNRIDSYINAYEWLNYTILELFAYIKTYGTLDETGYGPLLYILKWKTRGNIYSRDLMTMNRDIEQGKYTRLDKFQKDLFSVFKRARETTPIGSVEYVASVETQRAYILKRNQLCKHFTSQALSFDMNELDEELKNAGKSTK